MSDGKILEAKIVDADQLAKEFKEHSVAEFFKKNKQMLGLYGKVRTLTTVIHEYVTNSIDACEEVNILPDIDVKIEEIGPEYYEVTEKDNGPGLTKDTVGKALGQLLAGTKFHRMIQSRGQQGIGACMKSDTLVPMADGSIHTIKEIVDKNMAGEEVLSLDLDSLKLVPGKIVKCWKPKNPLFVKIKTIEGREISLTPENPVLVLQEGKPAWIRADEVNAGMKIAAPNNSFAASYSALYNKNISRSSLKQVLQTVGVQGKTGKELNLLAESDASWLEIKKVVFEKNKEEFVYDLEIEKHHNFVAGGIICHNSGCTMLAQMTTGKPTRVITGTGKGKPFSLELSIDPKLNRPKIANMKELNREFRGLAVQAKFKGVLYRDSEQGPLEYLRRTAIANPHAQIRFTDPTEQKFLFKRSANAIPRPPVAVKPHPKGVTVDEIVTLSKYTSARSVSSFLRNDFDRMGQKSLEEIVKKVSFDLKKDPKQLRWDEAEEIVKAFKSIDFIAPSSDALRPIGEERIKKSLLNIVEPEFLHVLTRKPQVYAGGFPFQVEVSIAYGGKAGRTVSGAEGQEKRLEIMRFANRAPLLFDAGNCAITKAVHSVDWKRYDIKDIENAAVTVLVNFISVYVPYTGAGKQAIADEDEVVEEIRLALMQSGRKAGRYISTKRKEAEKQMKREVFYKYIPEIVNALNAITKAEKGTLEKRLRKMVLLKLKLDEEKEAKEMGEQNAEENGEERQAEEKAGKKEEEEAGKGKKEEKPKKRKGKKGS